MLDLNSIHSEVNEYFVSNPYPKINEQIKITVRILKNVEIKKVFLRTLINGTNAHLQMDKEKKSDVFDYYSTYLIMNQKILNYHFIFITNNDVLYYTRDGVYEYPPTEDNDFVIMADFENPDWVTKSVFYQIFPDRFYCGNPKNSVKDGQYEFQGHKTIKVEWDKKPPEYNEGHCLDFYGGDLEGIKQKIDYFKKLGVNALYINPIFKAFTNHRYDCVDYFNVDDSLGGNAALIELVSELHKNDIKIIVDVSINHTGIEHHWYKKAEKDINAPERAYYYFNKSGDSKKWRGVDSLPQLNYGSKRLREIIYEGEDSLVRHYLKEPYNIDGWRFDVAMDTGRNDLDQFSNDIFKGVREAAKSVKNDCYLFGEHWKDNISYLLGDQLDGCMNYFATSRPLRTFAGEPERYLSGIVNYSPNAKSRTGTDLAKQIMQHYTRLPNQIAFLQFNLLDSHDIHRFHNNKDVFNFGMYCGMIIVLYMLPGTPSIYYGDEIGIVGTIETVEGCRYPMEWDESKWNHDFFNLYKKLSFLKQGEKALQTGSFKILYSDETTFVLARFTDKKTFIGVLSKNKEKKSIKIPIYLIGGKDGAVYKDVFKNIATTINDGNITLNLKENDFYLLEGSVEI